MSDQTSEKRKQGAIAGAAAFAAGLVGTVVLEGSKTSEDTGLLEISAMGQTETMTIGDMAGQGQAPSTLEVATWLYHKAHFASADISLETGDGAGAIAEAASLSLAVEPSTITLLLPVLVLGGAGYWLADQFDHDDAEAAAKTGAHVALGYAALAVATALLFEWSLSDGGSTLSIGVDVANALLLTGILYPAIVGGAGGYIQHERSDQAEAVPGASAPTED